MDSRLLDKEWRMTHLYKVRNKRGETVTFKKNRAQADFDSKRSNRNIILKSRQLGFTTYEAIDSLDDTLFVTGTDVLMRSYDEVSQKDIFDSKIVFSWNNLPQEIKELYELEAERANKLKFNWGDGTTSSITVRLHGRGGTYSRAHISEFAKICKNSTKDADEVITGDMPAVPMTGRIDIESTAEEAAGDFYNMWWEAWNRGDPTMPVHFKAFFYNWQWDDAELAEIVPLQDSDLPKEFVAYKKKMEMTDREITYYYQRWLQVGKSWSRLRREYPTTPEEAFEAAGEKFFDIEALDAMKLRDPMEATGHWEYFADYKPGHRYAVSADPSYGVGKDNATICVMDFDAKDDNGYLKPEMVAMYCCNTTAPDLLAYEIKNASTRYGNCIVSPERNNPGMATLAILKGICNNIYKEVNTNYVDDVETEKLGWSTNRASKPKMIFDLKTAISERLINIPCRKTVYEMKTYLRDDIDKVGGDGVRHWDRLIAVAICLQMQKYSGISGGLKIVEEKDFNKFDVV